MRADSYQVKGDLYFDEQPWWTLQRLNLTAKLHNTRTYSEISDTNRHALVYKCRCDCDETGCFKFRPIILVQKC